jgi:hypothetical protein
MNERRIQRDGIFLGRPRAHLGAGRLPFAFFASESSPGPWLFARAWRGSRVVCVLSVCCAVVAHWCAVHWLGALGTDHAHSHTSTQARLCSCAASSAPPRARAFTLYLRLSFAHRPNSTDSRTRPPSAHTLELHLSRPRSNLGHVPRGYTHPHGHAQHRSALCREDGSHPSEHLNHISYSHPNAHS